MKVRRRFVCEACGYQTPKWLGRCPGCGAWSTLVEEVAPTRSAPAVVVSSSTAVPLSEVSGAAEPRLGTGIGELDRVLGGGLVEGSLVLVGGDPGIGKSTLLLQTVAALAEQGRRCLYLTAEESLQQVRLRADRLSLASDNLYLLAETRLEALDSARAEIDPAVLVIDSIQTVGLGAMESAVGSVAQIRAATHHLMHLAKSQGIATFVVGHVTKEGAIAGPKVMEHMVDTVLYFEGDRTGPYRILRAHKNRFGSAQEIGVFEMGSAGLAAVKNPSELFLSQRSHGSGSTVVTSVEGSRPLLLEVQALATPSSLATPRRTTIGFDPQRLAMLCAVLSARAGFSLGGLDVYTNIAGGVRVQEPAADLGVLLALASAMQDETLPDDTVVIGEVGLSGEVRGVSHLGARVQEAASLGFARCLIPTVDRQRGSAEPAATALHGVGTVLEALDAVGLRP